MHDRARWNARRKGRFDFWLHQEAELTVMKLSLLPVSAFVGAVAVMIAACSAAGDLDFTPEPTPDASILPEEAGPSAGDKDAGADTGAPSAPKGPADRCEGFAIALIKEDASTLHHGRVTGTTAGLGSDYSSTFGGGSGADA